MAYVVPRRDGRFEIRESVQTERGPRSRTLANFSVLTDDVLRRAGRRAVRPFDRSAVVARAEKRGALVEHGSRPLPEDSSRRGGPLRFVAAARHFADVTAARTGHARAVDAGRALIELIGFAEAVTQHQAPRTVEALGFPPLGRLVSERRRP